MILNIYSVRDLKTEAFMLPFFAPTNGAATRLLTDNVNDGQSMLFRHSEDFTLFKVGTWDDIEGMVDMQQPEHIVDLSTLKNEASNEN